MNFLFNQPGPLDVASPEGLFLDVLLERPHCHAHEKSAASPSAFSFLLPLIIFEIIRFLVCILFVSVYSGEVRDGSTLSYSIVYSFFQWMSKWIVRKEAI